MKNQIRLASQILRLLVGITALACFLVILPSSSGSKGPENHPHTEAATPVATEAAPETSIRRSSAFEPMPFTPLITATKQDALFTDVDNDTKADPGDTLSYTVVITNSGDMDATGVTFTDTIDANTTLVPGSISTTPVARNDSFSAIGNVQISIAAPGVLTNDSDADGDTLTASAGTTTTAGGNLSVSANGAFTYNPPPGFEGSDTFTYTVNDGNGNMDTATATITVSGMIWFVNSAAAAGGDGRLTTPFNLLTGAGSFDAVAADDPGDNIFLFSGTYTGGLTLLNTQKLIGAGAAQTLSQITGLTPPTGSLALPATGGTHPIIDSAAAGVTLGQNNQLHGLDFRNTTTDITGSNFGTLTVRTVILSGNGAALNLSTGSFDASASFTSISSTNSATTAITLNTVGGSMTSGSTTIQNPTGSGINLSNAPSGSSFNFANTTVNASSNTGISLSSNVGSVTFADCDIAPDTSARALQATNSTGTITITSGTISTTTATAVEITGVSNASRTPLAVVLTTVSAATNSPNGILLTNTSGSFSVAGTGTAGSGGTIANTSGADGSTAGIGVRLENANNISLTRMQINDHPNFGIFGSNVNGFSLTNSNVNGANGTNASNDEGSVAFNNLLGSATVSTCTITGGLEDSFRVINTSGTLDRLTVSGSTFAVTNSTVGQDAFAVNAFNSSIVNVTVTTSNFTAARANLIEVLANDNSTVDFVFTGNTLTNNNAGTLSNAGGFLLAGTNTSDTTYNISGNTMRDSMGTALVADFGGQTSHTSNGRIENNQIGVAGVANSGSAAAGGIGYFADAGGGTHTVLINNNTVRQYNNHGILIQAGDEEGGGTFAGAVLTLNATITNNNVNTPGTINDNFNGMHLNHGIVSTDDFTSCLHIANNALTGGGKGAVAPNNADLRLRHRQATTVRLPGYVGPAKDAGDLDVEQVISFLTGTNGNTLGSGAANNVSTGGGYIGGAACVSVTSLALARESLTSAAKREEPSEKGPITYRDILFAPEAAQEDRGVAPLNRVDLDHIVRAALARWQSLGVEGDELARLEAITFEIADLPDDQLAIAAPDRIIIDADAAGYGWFVDSSPEDNEEFAHNKAKQLKADKSSDAFDRIDLFTAVARGLDYVLEHEWARRSVNRFDLMQRTLPTSLRRLPIGPIDSPMPLPEPAPEVQHSDTQSQVVEPVAPKEIDAPIIDVPRTPDVPRIADRSFVRVSAPGSYRKLASYAVLRPMAGETVTRNIGDLPPSKTVTITFRVTINNPLPAAVCSVSNQGTVSGGNFANVLTDDPDVAGATNPTVTNIFITPTITCPANISANTDAGQCTATVTFSTTTTGCPVPTVTCTPIASGGAFPVGTTTVTCTATNSEGSANCSFTVTVTDNQAPTITCPANITQGNDTNQCSAVVSFTPTANDNCPDPTVVCAPASGTAFPVGTTTVTCTATDAATLSANCSFTVTINDTQAPTLTPCPSNITTPATTGQCSATVNYTPPTATDNCPGVGTVVCAPASGSTFPVGTTTVTCSVADAAGNPASCSFTVTVQDTQPPSITCPANISVPTPAGCVTVNYTTPTPTDNCPGASVVCAPVSGTCFPVGTTTVTCTATDASGNMNTCMFTVSVVPCTITCPSNVTQTADKGACSAAVSYPPPTTTGDCGTVICNPASGSTFPVGTTTVTCMASVGPSCSFTVTVTDDMPPSAICPANIVTNNTAGQCSAVVNFTATSDDNCPGATVVCTPASGSTFPVGTTTVSCTATDASGNMSSPCTFTVTVNDTQAPTITCPANVTNTTSAGMCSMVINYASPTAMDNCPGVGTPVCNPPAGSAFPVGTTTVSCSVADASGNTANCSFTVTINDNQPPSITCPSNITVGNTTGQCSAVVNFTVMASDNCPGVSVVASPPSGSTFPVGTTTVTATAMDASGNTSSCMFTVTVNDTQAPTIVCPPTQSVPPGPLNYPAPTVTDNCPGATFVCSPPSGTTFPVGATTVTCTATDAAGNQASCSFLVTTFDICIEDNSMPGNKLLFLSTTGDYMFCLKDGSVYTGKGKVTKKGLVYTLLKNSGPHRVTATVTVGPVNIGTATLQAPPGVLKAVIVDTNILDNNCVCGANN